MMRELGFMTKNVEVASGEVAIDLSEVLFLKKSIHSETSVSDGTDAGDSESSEATVESSKPPKKGLTSAKKIISGFPEKVSFSLPKLDVKFTHRTQSLTLENNIMGIQLRSSKSQIVEDVDESTTHLDVQMDFSEIHLLREETMSVLEILKVVLTSSIDVPMQLTAPIRAEVDVKLGGTQCNILLSRLQPWLHLYASNRTKKMVLHKKDSEGGKFQKTDAKAMMWTCTVSAPEMTIVLYSFKGLPLYHGCSQSSHIFANNIATTGTPLHMELGEIHLHMADEYQESLKENLFGMEANSGSLMHIAKVSIDLGPKDMESHEAHDPSRRKLVFSVDITGMGVDFNFQRIESIVSTALSLKAILKSLSVMGKTTSASKTSHIKKSSTKGARLLKLNLERCSIRFCGDIGVENTVVSDPKRVNYGSQGGTVIISVSADGTPRTARITSMLSDERKQLKYVMCLDIFHLSLCLNKDKRSTHMDLERAKSVYEACSDENTGNLKVTLLDMQNAKFVHRPNGLDEMSVCSLFSATDIKIRWEPDMHLSLYELLLRLRLLLQKQSHEGCSENLNLHSHKEVAVQEAIDDSSSTKKRKKKELVLAVDVEVLTVSAELADGVEAVIQVQSIFSENAKIGVLLEDLRLIINDARVLRSSRMQISRIPSVPVISSSSDNKSSSLTTWDWIVQGLDVHICMAYRLQLRAIEDAVEDMWRGLKLVMAAKADLRLPSKKEGPKQVKQKSSKFGCLKFSIRKVTADIEEEPMQGWLDEHYQLMKKEVCELAIRLKFLEDIVSGGFRSSGNIEGGESVSEKKICHNGVEIDPHDTSAVKKLEEDIHKQAFRSYYQACRNMVISEGSGACREGFQAGFKPSTARASLLSLHATDLELSLTKIEGGRNGMIEFIRSMDSVCMESEIPFSRLYGSNISVNIGSLAAQLRNFSYPLFSGIAGQCEGRIVFAQQATCFQPQIQQDVFIGRWRRVSMLRSASGTTPPMKTYSDLPLRFQMAEVSFGVGFEPVFADISYAFTVALRRANLSVRHRDSSSVLDSSKIGTSSLPDPPKKERSLPWWDDVRFYVHGKIGLYCTRLTWNILATTDPYEKLDKLQIVSDDMDIQQSDGLVLFSTKNFRIYVSSLEQLVNNCNIKPPVDASKAFLYSPGFSLEVKMEWECESGTPLNHYLHALPSEGQPRPKVFDPFRSTSLSLRWNFSLKPSATSGEVSSSSSTLDPSVLVVPSCQYASSASAIKEEHAFSDSPCMYMGAHDLVWVFRWWNLVYNPPHKLRSFSRWPRFGVPRVARSGNLSLDKVMTEFMLRLDATPVSIKHVSLADNDPASGLTFRVTKLKYELCYSRGKQIYTFDCKRDTLDLVYQGLDLHVLKVDLNKNNCSCAVHGISKMKRIQQVTSTELPRDDCFDNVEHCTKRYKDDGFLLSSDYFTIRRQAPKADPARLLAWQEAGRKSLETTYVRSEFENSSESDHTRSDPSDDDGFNVVIADNCQRVFVYGLKLLWTIENRDAVWSWAGEISRAFEPPKPSPSRQYRQRKLIEEQQAQGGTEVSADDSSKPSPAPKMKGTNGSSPLHGDVSSSSSLSVPSPSMRTECLTSGAAAKPGSTDDAEEEGTRHFMVNVIQPQFNLHSEEANGRFLLAAASGRVLARSFHSVLHVGYEMIEQALGAGGVQIPEAQPEMTWKRAEFSAMLEHVQAHVAPTDVDPGAGLQWLPKIPRSSPKVKRTGALLERVFMPCTMYFRYSRHKGGTTDLKVKPLKELTFNSPNITATMTSRQFQVMVDILSNLLFARLPKPRKSSLSYPDDEDEDVGEEADEVVPDGVEEVELARINLEKAERGRKLVLDDIMILSASCDVLNEASLSADKNGDLWMITCGKPLLVHGLKKELLSTNMARKAASASLRLALRKAAQLRLMEKEKNKSPSYAMRISLRINKVAWSMLADGKAFAEAEINSLSYDFDRDYKDVGVAQFTTKYFVVRNCLPNAKSDMLLSAWNPPPEWGKNVMLRVDAKQGAPKDGHSPLELFQVEIYPLKIHLTESMYRMMWDYLFPEEEQDSLRRQEVWKVSTTVGTKRGKKGVQSEAAGSSSHLARDSDASSKHSATASASALSATSSQFSIHGDVPQASKHNPKANSVSVPNSELRRTSSFDRTWEESLAETIANELVLQVHSSNNPSSRSGPLNYTPEHQLPTTEETSKVKAKDSKALKPGRSSHEEKKPGKVHEEKRARARKMMEFHNIKISQVELLVTYEGSRFAVNDLRLLMDTFVRDDFTGTWRRLFSRVKKHIIWGVLKSVTGMQGKKFKDKIQSQRQVNGGGSPDSDLNLSDSDGGQAGKLDQFPSTWFKRPSDGAGDGFVTSIRGLFNSQRRKAKAFVLRTMRGDAENEFHGEWSESDIEFSPFARQLTITKAKRLIRRHTKKFRSRQKGIGHQKDSLPASSKTTPYQSDSSGASSPYEDFND
ncbi:protein SABRE isoform X2 [Nymphaea colorata]|uniref:protein SABRE isoform X2 n=1 Tax=Nymphaea colorata TaxID=210225 RepID=UPI00129EA95F|nr:protein SABRE isoform X2 [Nymphaea colorata]